MFQDLRFGVRMLLKQPGVSVIAVLTLALGIGATAAVFSLIQGVLLKPPPYRQPERVVLIPAVRLDCQPIVRVTRPPSGHPDGFVLIPALRLDGQPIAGGRGWPAAQWLQWQKEAKSFEAI